MSENSSTQQKIQMIRPKRGEVYIQNGEQNNLPGCQDWDSSPNSTLKEILLPFRQDIAKKINTVHTSDIAVTLQVAHDSSDITDGAFDFISDPNRTPKKFWRPIAFQNIWNTAPVYGRFLREDRSHPKPAKSSLNPKAPAKDGETQLNLETLLPTDKRLEKSKSKRGFLWREQVCYRIDFQFGLNDDLWLSILLCGKDVKLSAEQLVHSQNTIKEIFSRYKDQLAEAAKGCMDPLSTDGRLQEIARHYAIISQGHYQAEVRAQQPTQAKHDDHAIIENRHKAALNGVLKKALNRIVDILIKNWREQSPEHGKREENRFSVWGSVRAVEIDKDSSRPGEPVVHGAWERASIFIEGEENNEEDSFKEYPSIVDFKEHMEGKEETDKMGLVSWSSIHHHSLLITDFNAVGCVEKCWKRIFQSAFEDDNQTEKTAEQSGKKPKALSEVVIPIVIETGDAWGVLNLECSKKDFFKPSDVDFLHICARLLGALAREHLQALMDDHTTLILRKLGERKRDAGKGATNKGSPLSLIPKQIAKLLKDHLHASQISVTPWGDNWPISEEEVEPDQDRKLHQSATPLTLSQFVVEETRESASEDSKTAEHYKTIGIWLNTSSAGHFENVSLFDTDLASKDARPLDKAPVKSWGDQKGDGIHRTFIGVPIFILSESPEQGKSGFHSKPIAVCWIKYKAYVKYFSIKVREIAQLVRLLSVHLWHHKTLYTVADPRIKGVVYTRDALEYYLERARSNPGLCPQVAALIDMDDLRGMNSRRGYAMATRILNQFLNIMIQTCAKIKDDFERKYKEASLVFYADVFRYGGDEFMLFIRVSTKETGETDFKSKDTYEGKEVPLGIICLKEWEKRFRIELKSRGGSANHTDTPGKTSQPAPQSPPSEEGTEQGRRVNYFPRNNHGHDEMDDPEFNAIWTAERPSFSVGATSNLSDLLRDLSELEYLTSEGTPASRWVLDHLGACVRVAKHLGKGNMMTYEEIPRLVNATLYEYYAPNWILGLASLKAEIEYKVRGETKPKHRLPMLVATVLSPTSYILSVGEIDGVRRGMRFNVVDDVGRYTARSYATTDSESPSEAAQTSFDPRTRAELEVIEEWPTTCLVQLSRPGTHVEKLDMVILKRE